MLVGADGSMLHGVSASTQEGDDMSELPDPEDVADAPTAGDARSTTLQVLLHVDELEELEGIAAHRGLSTSAVAREAILRLVRAEAAPRSVEDRRLAQDWQIYP